MRQSELQVNSRLSQLRGSLPATANATAYRMTFSAFPIIGVSLTSPIARHQQYLGDRQVQPQATIAPHPRRGPRGNRGRSAAGVPGDRRSAKAGRGASDAGAGCRSIQTKQLDRTLGAARGRRAALPHRRRRKTSLPADIENLTVPALHGSPCRSKQLPPSIAGMSRRSIASPPTAPMRCCSIFLPARRKHASTLPIGCRHNSAQLRQRAAARYQTRGSFTINRCLCATRCRAFGRRSASG